MMVSRLFYNFRIMSAKHFSPSCITESNTAASFRWRSAFDKNAGIYPMEIYRKTLNTIYSLLQKYYEQMKDYSIQDCWKL
jgi:hypothetical protein